ncbi:MAG: hypothetical protein HY901_17565 [Deltaproteobacteria bacterium]|nr:hypothetical protein [Deltaproteobacteria bacterium]
MRQISIGLVSSALASALVAVIGGCDLSMTGKNLCNRSSDCLEGSCYDGVCTLVSSCLAPCGSACCDDSQFCDLESSRCLPRCIPDCRGKQCGDDGCQGKCGGEAACGSGRQCNEALHVCESCTGTCVGKDCGDDGCGYSCGFCNPWELCNRTHRCEFKPIAGDAGGGGSDAGVVGPGDASAEGRDAASTGDTGFLARDAGDDPSDAGEDQGADAAAEPGQDAGLGRDAE